MPRPFLIINPRSANGVTGRQFDSLAGAVRGAVGDLDHAFTLRPSHATEIARAALSEGRELVVACGGDGTINEVVNGFFEPLVPGQPARPIRPETVLGLVPRGTGGDFRRSLGLDRALGECARRLKGTVRAIDLGRVDYIDGAGKPASRLFANVADVGMGAEVADLANRSSKLLGGKITFALVSAKVISGWSDVRLRYSLDGGPWVEQPVTTFAVANGRYFGGGMMVAPKAQLDDGRLHLTIWSGYGMADFILKGPSMYDGSHVRFSGTKTADAKEIRLEAAGAGHLAGLEIDGERVGSVPATFTVLPGALRVVC